MKGGLLNTNMTTKEIKEYLERRLENAKQNRHNAKNRDVLLWYEAQITELIDIISAIR